MMGGSRAPASTTLVHDLRALLGEAAVPDRTEGRYLHDATEHRGHRGRADAVVLPGTTAEVTATLAWCDAHDVPVVPRGGGSGFAGGAVPDGGVVLSLERMTAVRSFDPLLWRIEVEAGVRTADLRRRARENGLRFPPDPGAAEDSQIGGNIATNAGGPHAFKYGVTGTWVSGLEVVVMPGEALRIGGPIRKDVAGYDLKSLMIGSEGTLGVITAAWLRLIPAPEAAAPVTAFYADVGAGVAAVEAVLGNGLAVAALEYLDAGTLLAARPSYPEPVPDGAAFMVLAEADGPAAEVEALRDALAEVLQPDALLVHTPAQGRATEAVWRWRDGVSLTVTARRGGKVSEDIVVPLDRLGEAITGTVEIGARHGLEACSWGHAGDGNLHSSFLVDHTDAAELERAEAASAELFALALALGGSISGEHGLGTVKRAFLPELLGPTGLELSRAIKAAFDPKGLLNPGKKLPDRL